MAYYIIKRDKLLRTIADFSKNAKVYYPIKANSNTKLITLIDPLVAGYEVDAFCHLAKLVKKLGVSPNRIIFSAPVKSYACVRAAIDMGVRNFVVENLDECQRISEISSSHSIKYIVRLDVSEFVTDVRHLVLKWGSSINEFWRIKKYIDESRHTFCGLSFYIPQEISNIDNFKTVLDGICKIDGFCNGKVVDIGGGFTSSMLDQMVSYIRQQGNYDHLNLLVEPGRYLLNPCIDMIVKIIDIRYKHGKKLVFIDSGIYDGLLDVIIKNKRFEIDIVRQHKNTIPTSDCILCGYSSDISDVIGIYSLPDDLTIGEKLRIQNCGAYCSELETKFCNNKKVNYRVDF